MDKQTDVIPPIPLSRLRKITAQFKDMAPDTPISFEFMMTAFFPSVYENIIAYAKECFTQGFRQGRKERDRDETEGTN